MYISQKCQYAVRAVLELSKHVGNVPLKNSDIAARQAIPERFLGIILNELKAAGIVQARRGVQGGFLLAGTPREITVGRVIREMDGPMDPVRCTDENEKIACPLRPGCSLIELWSRAKSAVEAVYDGTTFQDLLDREVELQQSKVTDFSI